jgi:hypothetical protein
MNDAEEIVARGIGSVLPSASANGDGADVDVTVIDVPAVGAFMVSTAGDYLIRFNAYDATNAVWIWFAVETGHGRPRVRAPQVAKRTISPSRRTASGSGISRSALLRITPVTRTSRSRSQFVEQCSPLQKIRRIEALADRGVRRCEDVVRFRGFTLCTQMTREPDGRPKHEG